MPAWRGPEINVIPLPSRQEEGDAGNQTRGILEKSLVAKYLGFYFRFLHINKIACKSHYIVFLARISIFK